MKPYSEGSLLIVNVYKWGYHSINRLRTGLKLVKYHTCSHSWEDHGNSGYDWNIMD